MSNREPKRTPTEHQSIQRSRELIFNQYQKNDYEEAEKRAQLHVKKYNDDVKIWQILGVCQRNLGKIEYCTTFVML